MGLVLPQWREMPVAPLRAGGWPVPEKRFPTAPRMPEWPVGAVRFARPPPG